MVVHHKIPQSRGGGDDEWNLVELSPFEHALEHALDFVLFPEISPQFDFRQPGWPLLPEDLQLLIKQETSRRMTGNQYAVGYGGPTGERNGNWGKAPCLGRKHTQETRDALSALHKGKPKSKEHREKLSKAKLGKKMGLQGPEARYNKSVGAREGWKTRDKEVYRQRFQENNPVHARVSCLFCRKETTKASITQHHRNCKPQ